MIKFEFKPGDLEKMRKLPLNALERAMKYIAICVWGELRKEAPVDHGRLSGSFDLKQIENFAWKIYSGVKYSLFVYKGTGIYGPIGKRIVPKKAKALKFEYKGRIMYRKSVKGQKPNVYVDRAMETTQNRVGEFIKRAMSEMRGV